MIRPAGRYTMRLNIECSESIARTVDLDALAREFLYRMGASGVSFPHIVVNRVPFKNPFISVVSDSPIVANTDVIVQFWSNCAHSWNDNFAALCLAEAWNTTVTEHRLPGSTVQETAALFESGSSFDCRSAQSPIGWLSAIQPWSVALAPFNQLSMEFFPYTGDAHPLIGESITDRLLNGNVTNSNQPGLTGAPLNPLTIARALGAAGEARDEIVRGAVNAGLGVNPVDVIDTIKTLAFVGAGIAALFGLAKLVKAVK